MIPAEEAGRGTYLKLFDTIGECVYLDPADEQRIDAAVATFVETHRDSVLDLTMLEGPSYKTLASHVFSWFVSTPESREYRIALNKANDDEHTEIKRTLGMWDED